MQWGTNDLESDGINCRKVYNVFVCVIKEIPRGELQEKFYKLKKFQKESFKKNFIKQRPGQKKAPAQWA